MKKLILSLIALFLMQMVNAQNISLNPKVLKNQGPNSNFVIEALSTITNNSNDTFFEWKLLKLTVPSAWTFSLCDPYSCSPPASEGFTQTFYLSKGASGEMKADFAPNSTKGDGYALVVIYSKTNPSTVFDTLTVQVNAWPTGVREVTAKREFNFFPNPAKDKLTVRYQSRDNVNIEIFNVLGSKVKSSVHTGMESDINISDLQSGLYFIRFRDGNQTISKSFTKTE